MTKRSIAVTGATGALGGRVARRLSDRGIPQRLVVRTAAKAPYLAGAEVAVATYEDRSAMVAAMKGIETVFFVSGYESEDRLAQHKSAIDAFVAAGVSRVVYTSFLGAASDSTFTLARQHYHTEEYMRAVGLGFVSLRNSLYSDILRYFVVDGVIRGPAGDGKFAPVARADVADVASAVLLHDDHATVAYDVTGPSLLSMADVAAELASATGQPVRYENETLEDAYASRSHIDAPQFEVEGWVTSYRAIAVGEMSVVSDTVERLTGHSPRTLREVLAS